MKTIIYFLITLFAFIMNANAQTKIKKVSVDTSQSELYWQNARIPAIASTTGDYLDGYPNVLEKKPGTKTPTLRELREIILAAAVEGNCDPDHYEAIKKTFTASNYSNIGGISWNWSYKKLAQTGDYMITWRYVYIKQFKSDGSISVYEPAKELKPKAVAIN